MVLCTYSLYWFIVFICGVLDTTPGAESTTNGAVGTTPGAVGTTPLRIVDNMWIMS